MMRTLEDETRATPDTIETIVQAEKDGVDAVIVDWMSDVGVKETRQRVNIPVIGPGEILRQKMVGKRALWLTAKALANDPLPKTLKAIQEGAKVIVIDGTGWSQVTRALEQALREKGSRFPSLTPYPLRWTRRFGTCKNLTPRDVEYDVFQELDMFQSKLSNPLLPLCVNG
jgi:putative N-acetylmannosamine-6-phosphate epimerase